MNELALRQAPFGRAWRSAVLVGALYAMASCSMSCPKTQPPPKVKQLTLEEAHGRLARESERRRQVAGLFKARLSGLQGLVANAELDLIGVAPDKLHVALRSFFGQPLQVLATDGERVTLYDAQGEGPPRYYEAPVSPRAAARVLGVPLLPREVVDAVLGRLPAGAEPVAHAVDDGGEAYTVIYDLPGGGRATLVAGAEDAIESVTVAGPGGAERYAIEYDDFSDREGIRFAETLRVKVQLPAGEESLVLSGKDVTLNGEPFPDEVFVVNLPPGEAFEPLPAGGGGRVLGKPRP